MSAGGIPFGIGTCNYKHHVVGTPLLQCVAEHIIEVVDNLSMLNSCWDNQDSHICVQYCTHMWGVVECKSPLGVGLVFGGGFLDFSGGYALRPHPALPLASGSQGPWPKSSRKFQNSQSINIQSLVHFLTTTTGYQQPSFSFHLFPMYSLTYSLGWKRYFCNRIVE